MSYIKTIQYANCFNVVWHMKCYWNKTLSVYDSWKAKLLYLSLIMIASVIIIHDKFWTNSNDKIAAGNENRYVSVIWADIHFPFSLIIFPYGDIHCLHSVFPYV